MEAIISVRATKFIRRMKGGSQACLLECDDGDFYVTKMLTNPQGPNVLANEWIGSALARSVGLRVPRSVIVEISDDFITSNPEMYFQLAKEVCRPASGLHFGSALVQTDDALDRVLDRLTYSQASKLMVGPEFTGIAMLDLLAEQQDPRQMVYSRKTVNTGYFPTFIDFGFYFRGPGWARSSPKSGPFRYSISAFARLWDNRRTVDSWLRQFNKHLPAALSQSVSSVPPGWYQGDLKAMHAHYLNRIRTFEQITATALAQKTTYNLIPSLSNERRAML